MFIGNPFFCSEAFSSVALFFVPICNARHFEGNGSFFAGNLVPIVDACAVEFEEGVAKDDVFLGVHHEAVVHAVRFSKFGGNDGGFREALLCPLHGYVEQLVRGGVGCGEGLFKEHPSVYDGHRADSVMGVDACKAAKGKCACQCEGNDSFHSVNS